ncbi:MAG TPA: ATP-binding protein [Stellaceae bacterium]|nr:ATP-binding protein [Stellaceae bacterium]
MSVTLPRLLRTSSFRLTVLYAGLFGVSVLILFAVIYWATGLYMTGSLDAAVDSDITELYDAFHSGGTAAVAARIGERVRQMPRGPIYYLLQDRGGRVLAGNLPAFHGGPGRFDLTAPERGPQGGERTIAIRARGVVLPGGTYLMVGADAFPRHEMHELILKAFGWGSVITLVLAFGGGALMSGGVLRRIETISRATHDIMDGDFSRRLPVRGTDDEFDHLVSGLNAMLDRMERSMESVRQVSNDIAHDLRTPLTRLRQRLERAHDRAHSVGAWQGAAARCIAELDAILETFGALLRIAQIDSGVARRRFARLDLSDLLHTLVEVYQPMADEKGQSFTVAIAAGLAVSGDRELLAQMLANVVENAMKHSPPGASVGLFAAASAGAVEVVVADDGPGIPAAEREHVFRRFYRLENSRSTPGSGLGLSLVAAIAALHQVRIDLADNGPGLRISLRFSPLRMDERSGAGRQASDSQPGSTPLRPPVLRAMG